MPSLSIFGAQWGDEGKGKLIDVLAVNQDLVVRYQGGANAGHTVVVKDEKYVLHLIPSGILHEGKRNVIGGGVAVDPIKLLEEIDGLAERGVVITPDRLRLAANAHVICEHHKRVDGLAERWKGEGRIGTTGRGIGPCYTDKASRTGLRICDLIDPERLRARLQPALAEKNALIEGTYGQPPIDLETELERYASAGDRLRPFVCDTGAEIRQAYRDGANILFEGAQGVLLDIDHGTYPFVTSSNTGVGGIASGAGFPPRQIERAVGIAKAYTTRVGEGPFPTELDSDLATAIRDAGNEYGSTTGRPRRAGWFDAVAVRYALELCGADAWIATKLDVLTGMGELSVAVAYRYRGDTYDRYPAHLPGIEEVEPIYETLPGWEEDISATRAYSDLPANARAYLERLEVLVGVSIDMISVGPARDATLTRGS